MKLNYILNSRIFYFLLLFYASTSFAQNTGNNIFKNLSFHSEFEKQIFDSISNKKPFDTLGLFMAIDKDITALDVERTKMNLFGPSDKYYASYNKSKPQNKFIKDLFNFTHKSFLKKYDIDVYFNSIEKYGTYNCVTASALYSLFFNRYNVSYAIKEAPTHVYLIANPGSSNIMIETTSPQAGYFMPDARFKKSYLDYLLQNKSITKEEILSSGEDQAFEKNYYNQENITLVELAALQYYNYGVSLYNNENYEEAFNQFEKAYALHPSSKIQMMLQASAGESISGSPLTDTNQVNLYVRSYLHSNSDKDKEIFMNNFLVFTQRNLVEKNNLDYYTSIYNRIMTIVNDSILRSRISFVYYSQRGRIAVINGKFDEGIGLIEKSLQINKDQNEITSLFAAAIVERYVNMESCASLMLAFAKRNEFLFKNSRFNEAVCHCYLKESLNYFAVLNNKKAFELIQKFESFQEQYQVNPYAETVGAVYGNASSYYIRKGDYKLGRKYLLKGLKISPTSIELNRKLAVLDNN